MMVVGGRTNTVGEIIPMEVYDTESSEWYQFNSVQRFRHCCWASQNQLYVHGGFGDETPNIPLNEICTIDTMRLLTNHKNLMQKIKPSDKSSKDERPKDGIKKNPNGYYMMDR